MQIKSLKASTIMICFDIILASQLAQLHPCQFSVEGVSLLALSVSTAGASASLM